MVSDNGWKSTCWLLQPTPLVCIAAGARCESRRAYWRPLMDNMGMPCRWELKMRSNRKSFDDSLCSDTFYSSSKCGTSPKLRLKLRSNEATTEAPTQATTHGAIWSYDSTTEAVTKLRSYDLSYEAMAEATKFECPCWCMGGTIRDVRTRPVRVSV